MTRALILAAAYPKAQAYPTLESAGRSGDSLALQLLQANPQLSCERLQPVPRLAANLKAYATGLDTERSLLVYCAGHLVLTPEAQPALLIDGEAVSSVPTARLLRALASQRHVLWVWDCMLSAAVPGANGPSALNRVAQALADEHRAQGFGAIVALSSWSREPNAQPSPLCQALAALLPAPCGQSLTASRWAPAIEANAQLFSQIECFVHCPPAADFPLIHDAAPKLERHSKPHLLASSPPPTPPVAPSVAPAALAPESKEPLTFPRFAGPVPDTAGAHDTDKPATPLAAGPESSSELQGQSALLDQQQQQGLHLEALQTARRCAALAATPAECCLYLSVAVGLARDELGHADWALALAEQALELAPGTAEGLHLVSSVLDAQGEWERLVVIYEQLLDQRAMDPQMTCKVGLAHSRVCRLRLADRARARRGVQQALQLVPDSERLHHELAGLLEEEGRLGSAFEHYQAALEADPLNPENYRRAYAFSVWSQEVDRAYQAAAALVHLGHADAEAARSYSTYAPSSLLPVQNTLKPPVWERGLLYPERDPVVAKFLQGCVRVARELNAASPKQHKKEVAGLLPQDAPSSTTTLARTLLWCTHLIGVLPPQLYLQEEPGTIRVARTAQPTVVASKALASGLSLPQLAFLWGRGLGPLRPEHQLYTWYSTPEDVAELLRGVGNALGLAETMDLGSRRLAKAFKRALTAGESSELTALGKQIDWSRVPEHARAWVRSVELACLRLGLVCCGDAALSAELAQRFPLSGSLTPEEQRPSILQFALSDQHAALRDALGVKHSSERPPAVAAQ